KNFGGFGNASIVKLTVDGKKIHFDSYVWPAEGLK
ncbi:MAG: histidine phosphatase family protein, partial [Lactobacillus crispatus]|nr:histidine phosphatase family protein [Lactobacillus crispatus]